MDFTNELEKARKMGCGDIRKIYLNFIEVLRDYIKIRSVSLPFPSSNLVLIGGGSGISTVGRSLYEVGISNFTSIASVMDVGGGSGVIQDRFCIPHMNDVMQHLINMNPRKNKFSEFMSLRTSDEWKQDGYIMIAAAVNLFGVERGIDLIGCLLENDHRALPVTSQPCEPIFTYRGREYKTYEFAFLPDKIGVADHVKLNVSASLLPSVSKSIQNANVAVIGPGDIHFSILPPMLVPGMYEALCHVRKIILIANLTARRIDIPGFTLKDYIAFWKKKLPQKPKCNILVNSFQNINQEDPPLKDDIHGDYYMDCHIHRANIAGHSLSRNKQPLHDKHALGKSLKYILNI